MADDSFTVQLERSGGIAGASFKSTVDSAALPASDAADLRTLLDRVDLGAPSPPPKGADRFQYDIKVERGGQTRNVTAYDGSLSPELKALIDWLGSHSRRPKDAA
ncbi:MAG TPA: protealysin inhibitor emfourin [Candidatus Dormibacteraeota bacterium]|nr:protealysin inhibitor emfourin [Candidatus Dormibacteraeota bacterium]